MTALKGAAILQRERMGDEHAPSGAQIAATGGDLAETTQKSPRSDQKRGDREIPNSQTASRTAENGLSKVVAPSVGAVWVTQSGAGDVMHIVPPTVGAHVVEFTRTPHAAHVEFAIRRTLVGQDH